MKYFSCLLLSHGVFLLRAIIREAHRRRYGDDGGDNITIFITV